MRFDQWANQQLTRSPHLFVGRYRKGPEYLLLETQEKIYKFFLDSGGTITVYESAFKSNLPRLNDAFLRLCEQNGPGHYRINGQGITRYMLFTGNRRAVMDPDRTARVFG